MNELRKWVKNANMTQKEFAKEFEIPIRTVEDWMTERSNPPIYVKKLIIEKLKQITEKRYEEFARKKANTLKSDENGKRPIGTWTVISTNGNDEFLEFHNSMQEAINNCETEEGDIVAYILCNQSEDGTPDDWYTDKNGDVYSDYNYIDL